MIDRDVSSMAIHKIGAVSKFSGVPTYTLRIWESQHATFEPRKTAGQHRLYSDDDVLKATLLKRLIEQGHAISNIGRLETKNLNALLLNQGTTNQLSGMAQSDGHRDEDTVSIAIVGLALATRLGTKKFTLNFRSNPVQITDVFTDLTQALTSDIQQTPDVLLVKLSSLHATTQLDLHRMAAHCGASQVILLYNFGPEHIVESLKSAGMLARREPISDSDLSELIQSARALRTGIEAGPFTIAAPVKPRQYSEETLARVAAMPATVVCECPRHVAEIISQLGSFEQYSMECLNASTEDAHLHAYLSTVAGSARALFERALQVIADHEGIELGQEGA
jgi:DNA-binding transcriptional MerR regulator